MESFLIIDGNSLLHRAFYALPLLTNRNGEYSNAVYGFSNMLIKVISENKPDFICVAFDAGKKNFRHDIYPDYKGTRKKTPDELVSQFALSRKLLSKMGIKVIEKVGIEADDIIGTLAKKSGVRNILLSGDKDLLQLVDKNTEVWLTKKGISEILKVDEMVLKSEFSWTPNQVIDFKALCGETSDNIPGVAGIGEKTAQTLLDQFNTLDNIYENISSFSGKLKEKLENGRESALMSKRLATIKTDCEFEFSLGDCQYQFPFGKEVFSFFEEYDFRSLLRRKELFSESFQEKPLRNEIDCEEVIIQKSDKIDSVIKAAREEKRFAFDIDKRITFSVSPNVRYVLENELTLFSNMDELEKSISKLKDVFEDDKIEKVFYDYKKVLHYLDERKILVRGSIFDISIASYLLTAGQKANLQRPDTNEFFEEKKELSNSLKNENLYSLFENFDLPLSVTLFKMEKNGFKVDKTALSSLSEKYRLELNEIQQSIFNLCGEEFNLNSPKQLSQILFDKLKLASLSNKAGSTGIEVLNELESQHPVIPLIMRYRKIQKLLSTYIEPYVSLLQNGDIIHTIFNQTLTSTGRLSSSEPNLQNIPVRDEEGRNLRKIFVSKFENGTIMSADYNQIELRLLASFSGDENLVEAFREKKDIHASTAALIFGKKIEDVTQNERRNAKAVNFGVIYGISDYGLSQNTGLSRREAKDYISKYFLLYPSVKTYMDENVAFAKENGYALTAFGRKRRIAELKSSNFMTRSFGERVAMNMPLQGTASDVIKKAMIEVSKALDKENLKSQLILQIHDELIVDVYPGEETRVRFILRNEMENSAQFLVPLPVEISSGKTWFDAK